MMGPLLTFQDEAHLDHLLTASRAAKIDVRPDGSGGLAFMFSRGWGLVHASRSPADVDPSRLYFGFGHPFNPLRWSADSRLLREIERIFLGNGSSRIGLENEK